MGQGNLETKIGKIGKIKIIMFQINNETDLVYLLKDRWKTYFHDLRLVSFDYPVLGCFSYEKIGIVDIVFGKGRKKCNDTLYFVEVKYSKHNPSGDFWDSLKILGYVEAERMRKFNSDIKPIIMINKDNLKYDYRTILASLKVGYIAFNLGVENDLLGFERNF